MKRQFSIAIIALLTAIIGHAADDLVVVDGVIYEWSPNELGYIVTGWDEETPIQSLHIRGEVEGLDVVGIAAAAFEDNEDIVFLTIDEGIGYIGQNAFCRCYNLEVAILPEGLVTIEEEAFAFCYGIKTMVIPSTVQDIESHAFSGCTGVTDVYFLMNTEDQLDHFNWWDGVYLSPGEDEHGGMEFNTNENTVVHVPAGTYDIYDDSGKLEAWLFQEDNNSYPLWWIVNFGVEGRTYTVSDALTAVYVDLNDDLYAKDHKNWLMPDKVYPGEVDYMNEAGFASTIQYDQSNWVILRGMNAPTMNRVINGGSITGTLVNKTNPVIELDEQPEFGGEDSYTPNVYIAAALMGRTQTSQANGKTYAFVRPKPQEFAKYEWSIYAEDGNFYVPAHDPELGMNTADLAGGFKPNFDLLEEGDENELLENACYPFKAITRCQQPGEDKKTLRAYDPDDSDFRPNVEGGVTTQYEVFPLTLSTDTDPIITGIAAQSMATKQDNHGFYNLNGIYLGQKRPDTPGIYIHGGKKVHVPPAP